MLSGKVAKDHMEVKNNCFTLHPKTLCCIAILKIQRRILPLVVHSIKAAFCSTLIHNGTFSQNYGVFPYFSQIMNILSLIKKKIFD